MHYHATLVGQSFLLRPFHVRQDGPVPFVPIWQSGSEGITLTPQPDGTCGVNCTSPGFKYVQCHYTNPLTGKASGETVMIAAQPHADLYYLPPQYLGVVIYAQDTPPSL